MREIKFKLWYKPTKKMYYYEPTWGNYGHGGGWVGGVLLEDYLKNGRTFAPSNQMQLEPESCEWLLYTDLDDINFNEICEGDIIDICYQGEHDEIYDELVVFRAEIVWENGGFWFRGIDKNITDCNWHFYNREDRRILGNIYENPELLTPKQ